MRTHKCKTPVAKPGFPLAYGKKVVVAVSKAFKVADHDFSKLSLKIDAHLLPDEETQTSSSDNNAKQSRQKLPETSKKIIMVSGT